MRRRSVRLTRRLRLSVTELSGKNWRGLGDHAGVWGVAAGVLHFVPYLGSVHRCWLIAKSVCDRVESLKPAGELLGR